jgi:predicted RNA binding protein YcfA (HicA-like mRNA interferase family)
MPKVRDAIRLIESHGWRRVRTRGSHQQFSHPERPGLVTVAGKPSQHLAIGTWLSILRQAGIDPRGDE